MILFFCNAAALVRKGENTSVKNLVGRVSLNGSQDLRGYLDALLVQAQALAQVILQDGGLGDAQIRERLLKVLQAGKAEDIALILADGTLLTASGEAGIFPPDISAADFLTGEASVSPLFVSPESGENRFAVFSPVYNGNERIAALLMLYDADALLDAAAEGALFEGAVPQLLAPDGSCIAFDSAENSLAPGSLSALSKADFQGKDSFSSMLQIISEGGSGVVQYALADGSTCFAAFSPIGLNGWYLLEIVPKQAGMASISSLTTLSSSLPLVGFLAGLLLLGAIVFFHVRNKCAAHASSKEIQRINEERFKIAFSHLRCLIFEYNFITGRVSIYETTDGKNRVYVDKDLLGSPACLQIVSPDDRQSFFTLRKAIFEGERTCGCDLRLKLFGMDGYKWCRVNVTNLLDERGKPAIMIGSIEDIDGQKKKELSLTQMANQDPLTRLLNRTESERQLEAYLKEGPDRAGFLMLLDMDDLKVINDLKGHPIGDQALIAVADVFHEIFKKTDILARIGGDEFLVFIKDTQDESILKFKISMLRYRLSEKSKGLSMPTELSFSLGYVAVRAGDSFESAYKKADIALYRAKWQGKNQHVAYSEALSLTNNA